MRYSRAFIKTFKETPREAENISSSLLLRGGYIDQEMTGVYTLLPLGWKAADKISDIIREEMDRIDGQEILMPAMQPRELWEETDRWDKMDPPLFKLKDRHQKDIALGSTHEEVIVDLARVNYIGSAGLALLIRYTNPFCRWGRGDLHLAAPSTAVSNLLQVAGLVTEERSHFSIYPTVSAAQEAVQKRASG